MESGRTWNDNAGIAGGLVWMHGNSGDMDAGGWHAIGGFRARTCQRKGAYRLKRSQRFMAMDFCRLQAE